MKLNLITSTWPGLKIGTTGAILWSAAKRFSLIDGTQWAGAFAFNMIFSLFPLIILLASVASFFLNRNIAGKEVIAYMKGYVPISGEMQGHIFKAVGGVIKARTQTGAIAFILLIWVALQSFLTLTRAINRAWEAEEYHWWRQPLKSLVLLGITAGAVLLGMAVSVLLRMANGWAYPLQYFNSWGYDLGSFSLPIVFYTKRWETGKAMIVCIDKITTVRMYNLIMKYWQIRIKEIEEQISNSKDEQEEIQLRNQLAWIKSTDILVIISEEQNEVKKFESWGLNIVPHREKIKKGYETPEGKTIDVDLAFKDENHPFRIAIVCAMWLTGFDVPSLSTLCLDKPLKAHTLMQAVARANRVNEGKNNGLIVDYCGILKNLRKALATYATGAAPGGKAGKEEPPIKPEEDLIKELRQAIDMVKAFLKERNFSLNEIITTNGFERIAAITKAKEAINQSEETRKRFEIQARVVFMKFKACITVSRINEFRKDHDAIDIIYKKLQDDRDKADISQIIKEMHEIVDGSVMPAHPGNPDDNDKIYDISKIDFEKLKAEFEKSPRKNTTVQCLKDFIESKLQKMLERNPLRTDFNKRYQEIISEYNFEKDRATIEKTFEKLMRFVQDLDDEEKRTVREGLDEEHLALFDLLLKPNISTQARNKIKRVSKDLLDTLKAEKLRMDHWRNKDQTCSEVKSFIHDFLWDETRGLPTEAFSNDEVDVKAELVFDHVFRSYEDAWHNKYAA